MQTLISSLDRNEILRYLGYRGTPLPAQIDALLDECIQITLERITPKYRYGYFPLRFSGKEILVEKTGLTLTGASIHENLAGCRGAVLLACTIGLEHEKILRRLMVTRPDAGVVLDSCGSVAVEAVAEIADAQIRALIQKQSLFARPRFSPGYGDLPLTCQQPLLDALRAFKTMGLTVGSGHLLAPNKSITAIIGVSETPYVSKRSPCDECLKRLDCEFKRRNQTCYSKG